MKKTLLAFSALCALSLSAVTVWNGEDVATGGGWAGPKNEINFFKPQTDFAHNGTTALELHGEGAEWIGGGWNWMNWWPENGGTDLTAFSHLTFWIRQSGDAIENLTVTLVSSITKNPAEPVPLANYVKAANLRDAAWHEIVIPVADFKPKNDETPFDPKAVWEIIFGSWAQYPRAFSLYIDDIDFINREQKIDW